MKLFRILIIALTLLISASHAAYQLYADKDSVTIPYGTKFELLMSDSMTTRSVEEGDMFEARLKQDLYVNNKLVLPQNTVFRGRVSGVKLSKTLSRPAVLYLSLDHLVTKQGLQLPIHSGIASEFQYILKSDGAITTNGNYFKAVNRDLKKAGQIVPRTINWGKTSGDDLFVGAKVLFVPVAALGGSVACVGSAFYNTIADLFRRGDEIIIKKGDSFNIILLGNLDVPI